MRRADLVLHYNSYNIPTGEWKSVPVGESVEQRGNQLASCWYDLYWVFKDE